MPARFLGHRLLCARVSEGPQVKGQSQGWPRKAPRAICVNSCGALAQSVEHRTFNPLVDGSIPSRPKLKRLLRPDESFYVREIGRLTGVPTGPLHRELKALAESGLLARSVSGNQVRYQAARDCPIFPELAGIFRKTAGLADVLRESLSLLTDKIALAFVFGSVAQGKERPTSDIDLLVVGSVPFENVVEASHSARERLGREVNPLVMSRDDFRAKQRGRDRFLSRVLKEPKIFVIGDASELKKLAEDRAA